MSREGRGTLFVVATPIGNLGDITLRAIETLRSVTLVLAEDTRRTRALLAHLGIEGKPLERLDAHVERSSVARVIERLIAGEDVALCTDAGTPSVSDPGALLVAEAAEAGVRVTPIPGASAVAAAVSASGLGAGPFRFFGFLPRSGPERRDAIATITTTPELAVLFEAPGRLGETLADLAAAMPSRRAAVCRELTKLHEEITRGALADLAALDREWLGEVTLVLGPAVIEARAPIDPEALDRRIDEALAGGARAKDLSELLALETGLPKRDLYGRIVARKRGR